MEDNLKEIIFTTVSGLESIISEDGVEVVDGFTTHEKQVLDDYRNGVDNNKACLVMIPLNVEEGKISIAVVLNESKPNIIGLNEFLSDYTHFLKDYADQKDNIQVSFNSVNKIPNEIFRNFISIHLPFMKANFEIIGE